MITHRKLYMLAAAALLAACSNDPTGIEHKGPAGAQQEETMRDTENVPPAGVNKCRAYRTDEFCQYS